MREAVTRLASRGLHLFTVEELRRQLQITPEQARALAHRLHRTSRATRVRRGLYALVPPAEWDRPGILQANWYLTAAAIVEPSPYFLAFYTAMEIHRMTQHPLRTVFVAVTRQRREIRVGQVRFRFVTLKPERFFGFEDLPVQDGRAVKVADLERTFLHCVDRLDQCGGIDEVVRGFAKRHADLDPDRLLRYVHRLNQPTVVKRLGFLLEVVGHGDRELLWDLQRAAARHKRYVPLDTGGPNAGTRDRRWGLIVNADFKRLIGAART